MNDMISVIIPIYNMEKYLKRCLDSVVNQTYKELEIILVDDGSSDSSGSICDTYATKDDRIKVIHQKNSGVSAARNAGLDIASGNYMAFVDPDDYIDTEMYQILISEMMSGDYDIVECNYARFYENNETVIVKPNVDMEYVSYKEIWHAALTDYLFCGVWNKLFKRSVIGEMRFNIDYKVSEDMLFFFECAKKTDANLKYINKTLYYYLQRDDSAIRRPFNKGRFDMLSVLEKILESCVGDYELISAWNSYYLPNLINVSQNIVVTGKFSEKYDEIRNKIIKNKYTIFKFKPYKINEKVRAIRKIDKLYVFLLWACPNLLRLSYSKYSKLKNRNR